MDVCEGERVAHQVLSSSLHQAFLYSSQHRQHGALAQLSYLGRLLVGVLLEVSLDGDTDDVFDSVHNLINLGRLEVVSSLEVELSSQEPEIYSR